MTARLFRRLRSSALANRWQRTLYVMFLAQLVTAVGFSSIFPFLPLYVESLGSSYGLSIEFLSGAVFSGQAVTMMLASPFWGAMADRYGRKLMVERAMFGGTFILLAMAFVRSAEQLVLLRMVQGLVTGTVAAGNALVAAEVPRERSGYALGLVQVGLSSGLALGPLIGGLIADGYGYSAAFYITAVLLLAGGLLVHTGVHEDFRPSGPRAKKSNRWRDILAVPGIVSTYWLRFLNQLGRTVIIPVAPLFIQTLLAPGDPVNTFTGLVVGVSSATTTLGAVFLGRLGDRAGHRRIVIACSALAALLYVFQSRVAGIWQLFTLQALVGVAMGGIIPAIGALLAGYTSAGMEGAVYGLDSSIDSAARSLAPLVGSAVALALGLRATFTSTALMFLIMAGLAAWRLPPPRPFLDGWPSGTEVKS